MPGGHIERRVLQGSSEQLALVFVYQTPAALAQGITPGHRSQEIPPLFSVTKIVGGVGG